jgi:hypothetical protein
MKHIVKLNVLMLKVLFLLLLNLSGSCKKQDVNIQDPGDVVITQINGYSEILGRPTGTSVTMNVMFDQQTDVYLEYGTTSGTYDMKTTTFSAAKDTPVELDFTNLTADTKYFYRTRYLNSSTAPSYLAGTEHSFHTQRSPGSTFTFTVESDEHLYDKKGVKSIYQICLNNQAADTPDFMLDLGDIFGDDHNPTTITPTQIDLLHKQYRPFLGSICHSIPFYVCLGNHEGENNYYMALNPQNNLCVNSTLSRKLYYPNPFPNSFYSGNTDNEAYGIGNPENYYSWTWGDVLFIVLDVYRYENSSTSKPEGWKWTLGFVQYNWLKNTLENSNAKYKLVFAHHLRGQGRGGITMAKLYEWGGYESDGVTYGFTANRPGWAKPIHKLFVDNKVNIFFQGHDHVFSHEVLDGVTYQALPMPSDSTYQIGILANGAAYTSDVVGGTGHLRVNVTPAAITVDFVQAILPADESTMGKNGKIAFTYTVK